MDVAVVSLGCPSFAEGLVKNLDGKLDSHRFTYYPAVAPPNYHANVPIGNVDVLWNIGFFFGIDNLFMAAKALFPNLRVVNDWSGSDILWLKQMVAERPRCLPCLTGAINLHTCDWWSYRDELKELNINALVIPSIPSWRPDVVPLPEKPAVLYYLPVKPKDFFLFPQVVGWATQLKVPFNVVGNEADKALNGAPGIPPNMKFHGHVSAEAREKLWKECSVFLYTPQHGSWSVLGQEMQFLGRWVASTLMLPQSEHIPLDRPETGLAIIRNLLAKKEVNQEGADYVKKERTPEKLKDAVKKVMEVLTII